MTIDTLGIVGTGDLAGAIAGRIGSRAGVRVIVHGFETSKSKKGSVERAANLFDLASECQAVIAMYETHALLRQALVGDADRPGLLGAMAPGTLLVDFSGGSPDETWRLAGALSGGAIGLVEGVIIGSPDTVRDGMARVLLGGFPTTSQTSSTHCTTLGK